MSHNYIGHNYIGHNFLGHKYIGTRSRSIDSMHGSIRTSVSTVHTTCWRSATMRVPTRRPRRRR